MRHFPLSFQSGAVVETQVSLITQKYLTSFPFGTWFRYSIVCQGTLTRRQRRDPTGP